MRLPLNTRIRNMNWDSEAELASFRSLANDTVGRLVAFLEDAARPRTRVIHARPLAELERELGLRKLIRDGGLGPGHPFLDRYLEGATRLHSPNCMAHQVAAAFHPSAVGDLIAGVTNNASAIYEMGPTAVAVELAVLEWMIEKVGWDRTGPSGTSLDPGPVPGGILTHGGSLANLTALLAARAAMDPSAWQDGVSADLAVLAAPSAHYSLARAVGVMGMGERSIYPLAVDSRERLIPDRIREAHGRALAEGRRVVALCASACATATGLYDPLEECGRYCGENGIWFHVDGAHGASALISPRERGLMRGVHLADSLVWDAHKMLHTSALCTAVLVRDQRTLTNAFRQDASYVLHPHPDPPGPDLLPRSIECTKGQIGLKAFMNLAVYGEAGLARVLEGLFSAARRFAEVIRGNEAFEVPFEPESNIVCFRYRGGDDDRQEWIRSRLVEDGRYYISSANVAGRRHLRLAIMNPRTDEGSIRGLLALIEELA